VIDFIDMVLPSNRELLLRRLVECLGRDRTRHQVAEVTSLGLVQMTRKKIGTGLLEAFTTECEHCHGRGYEISDVPVETQKQPDGGSRDNRGGGGGGGGGGRGRGRGNQSSSGSSGTTPRPHQPIPAALRPDHGAKPDASPTDPAMESASQSDSDPEPVDVPASDQQPIDLQTGDQQSDDQEADDQQSSEMTVTEQLAD
jgi:ribonuclease E